MPITASRSSSAGWPSPACRRSPASGPRTRSSLFAYEKSPVLWAIGLVTALLTAFYMSRQVFLVFFGEARWDRPIEEAAPELAAEREAEGVHEGHGAGPAGAIHPHESPWLMTLPLVVLAVLAVFGGGLNLPVLDATKYLEHWLEPVIHFGEAHPTASTTEKVALAGVATTSLIGLMAAVLVYLKGRRDLAAKIELPAMLKGWYYDSSISAFMGGPGRKVFQATTDFDKTVVDGAVNGVGTLVAEGSTRARLLQTGYVRNHALGLTIGVVVVVGLLFSKAVF
jgi:NADH-quinone oxidoreductase subunit L